MLVAAGSFVGLPSSHPGLPVTLDTPCPITSGSGADPSPRVQTHDSMAIVFYKGLFAMKLLVISIPDLYTETVIEGYIFNTETDDFRLCLFPPPGIMF